MILYINQQVPTYHVYKNLFHNVYFVLALIVISTFKLTLETITVKLLNTITHLTGCVK